MAAGASTDAATTTVNKKDEVKRIPIRATIFSAMSVVIHSIVFGAIHNRQNMTYHQRGLAIRTVAIVMLVIRCPLTAIITFAFNKKKALH